MLEDDTDAFVEKVAQKIAGRVAREVVDLLTQRQRDIPVASEYITLRQAAQLAGYSLKGMERLHQSGKGPKVHRVGRSVRFRADEVRAWIEGRAK